MYLDVFSGVFIVFVGSGVWKSPNEPKLSHSRSTVTPADTPRSGTATPPRNGEAGRLLALAQC
jgi:hypothetical protein